MKEIRSPALRKTTWNTESDNSIFVVAEHGDMV